MPVVELADHAFFLSDVKTVVIPDSIIRVGNNLFNQAEYLQYVKLPTSMTNLQSSFFYGCTALEYFEIPPHITNIEDGVFAKTGLRSIEIPETVQTFQEKDDYLSGAYNLFWSCENLEHVKLP